MEFKGYRNCAKTKTSTGYTCTCTSSINAKIKETIKIRLKLRSFSRPGLPFSETCEHLHAPKNDKMIFKSFLLDP